MDALRRVITFAELQTMGWPYCRVHTMRLMHDGKIPLALKLGDTKNAHIVWFYDEWPPYFEARRLAVKTDSTTP